MPDSYNDINNLDIKKRGHMRNYNRCYSTTTTNKEDINNSKSMKNIEKYEKQSEESRTRIVIDENTIYEIDLDCYECLQKKIHQKP